MSVFEKNTEKAHIIAQRNIDNEFNGNVVLANSHY